jgi:hypothetical protein
LKWCGRDNPDGTGTRVLGAKAEAPGLAVARRRLENRQSAFGAEVEVAADGATGRATALTPARR